MARFQPTVPENTSVTFQEGSNDNAGRITVITGRVQNPDEVGLVDGSVLGKLIFDNPKGSYVATITGRLNGADEIFGTAEPDGFYIGAPDDTVSLRENLYSIKYHIDDLPPSAE